MYASSFIFSGSQILQLTPLADVHWCSRGEVLQSGIFPRIMLSHQLLAFHDDAVGPQRTVK